MSHFKQYIIDKKYAIGPRGGFQVRRYGKWQAAKPEQYIDDLGETNYRLVNEQQQIRRSYFQNHAKNTPRPSPSFLPVIPKVESKVTSKVASKASTNSLLLKTLVLPEPLESKTSKAPSSNSLLLKTLVLPEPLESKTSKASSNSLVLKTLVLPEPLVSKTTKTSKTSKKSEDVTKHAREDSKREKDTRDNPAKTFRTLKIQENEEDTKTAVVDQEVTKFTKYKERQLKSFGAIPFPEARFEPKSLWKTIGYGSHGTVYKVYDKVAKRNVALKEVTVSDLKNILNEVFVLRYINHELKGKMENDSFLKLYNVYEWHSREAIKKHSYLMETELLDESMGWFPMSQFISPFEVTVPLHSKELKELETKRKEIPLFHLLQLSTNFLHTLKQLHSLNIAHRDIKPDNIMININTRNVKLIDFGDSCYECTPQQHSLVRGSLPYLAPELLGTSNRFNSNYVEDLGFALTNKELVATDLWSAGLSILCFLTNVPPWDLFYKYNHHESKQKTKGYNVTIQDKLQYFIAQENGTGITPEMWANAISFAKTEKILNHFIESVVRPLLARAPHQRLIVV
jgi:hypothetical protein